MYAYDMSLMDWSSDLLFSVLHDDYFCFFKQWSAYEMRISDWSSDVCSSDRGEVLQLLHVRNPDVDEAAYLRVIERKTAVLYAAATRLGALLSSADPAMQARLHDYGLALSHAFQIADDVLDYSADEAALGKPLGDDLAEGKATLPLIHAMAHSDAATRERLRAIIEHGDVDALPDVIAAIHAQGSLDFSRPRAVAYAEAAERPLDGLEDNDAVAAPPGLARYATQRHPSRPRGANPLRPGRARQGKEKDTQ